MCHAKNPQTLRGTILRKDLATKSMVKGDIPVNDIADFMGHDPKIHVDHYRLPRATRDLTRVSRMLMIGNGIEVDAVGDENNTVLEDSNHSITNNADLEDVIPSISGPYNLSEDHNSMSSITKSSGKVSPKICSKAFKSPSQLKTWLHNQMKNKKSISYRVGHLLQFSLHVHQTRSTKLFFLENKLKVKRSPWSSFEKSVAVKYLSNYIEKGILPSMGICREIIENNSVLKNRTPIQLKLFVNNRIKKNCL
ncbi:hypothetical protein JTB14_001010 [Gonioctena quinquepunctata]|nr:hypothetical protein JTB14_001010 [Gonioctena quinquepunctata]